MQANANLIGTFFKVRCIDYKYSNKVEEKRLPQAQKIIYLTSRFIDGSIDFAELQELNAWKNASSENERLFSELIDKDKQQQAIHTMQQYDTEASLQKIKEVIAKRSKNTNKLRRLWPRIAVAASLLAFATVTIYLFSRKTDTSTVAAQVSKPSRVVPGSDKAVLTLAGGQRIVLQAHANGILAQQSGVQIVASPGGKISYVDNGASTGSPMITYNTIETPRGGKYQLQLPDGTKVWLNAASSLRYPVAFTGNSREVELTGEAYFEVAKDRTKPFSVTSATQKVTVLGTHFNINAYKDEPHTVTTLVEGSVKVASGNHSATLLPGQQSAITSDNLKVSKADIYVATAWKDGKMAFLRTDVKNILRQLSRWYDIDIEYKGTVPDFSVSGDVSRDADLSAMIRILELYDVHCKLQGRTLVVSK